MTMITNELLEALLSPDLYRRQAAESHFVTLGVHSRIEGLIRHLEISSSSTSFEEETDHEATQHLAAVLLRQDILLLTQASELQALVSSLLSIGRNHPQPTRGIYDCLAQICSSLQMLDMAAAVDMVTTILKFVDRHCRACSKAFYESNAWRWVPPVQDGDMDSLALVVTTLHAAPEASLTLPRQLPLQDSRVLDLLGQAADSLPRLFMGRNDLLPVESLSGVQLLVQLLQHDGAFHEFGSLIPTAMETCWRELVQQSSDWDLEAEEDESDQAQVLLASLVPYPGALSWLWPVLDQAVHGPQLWLPAILALEAAWDGAPQGSMEYAQTATAVALASPLCGASIRLLGLICEHTTVDSPSAIVKRLVEGCALSRTARWACDALSTFAQSKLMDDDDQRQRMIETYLSDVLTALAGWPMSTNSRNDLKVQALGTVAIWATAAGDSFGPYYSQWVPTLLQMISTGGLDNEALMSACLETATVIGQAVPDAFFPDAFKILESISFDKGGTQQPCCVLVACARIASVLKEAYTPFLDKIIPHLLGRINDRSSDLEIAEGYWQTSDEVTDDSVTVALPGKGLTKVTINTTKVQEKAQLARAVYEHVVAVGLSYGPYCQGSLEAFLPLVEFMFSSDVRGTSAQTVAALFEAACMAGEASASMSIPRAFLSRTLDTLSRQLESEDVASDMEVYYAVADAQSDITRMMYLYGSVNGGDLLGGVEENDVVRFVSRSMKYLTDCLQRRTALTTKLSSVYGPDLIQEIDNSLQKEEALLTPLVDSVGWLLKTYKDSFVSIFERLAVPVLGSYLHSGNDVRATLSSVCLFDDCIEFCGPSAASKYSPMLLQGILRGLSKDAVYGNDTDLKRASIYGVAQIARHAPSNVLEPHARWIVQELNQITSNPELHDDAVYENAISALASLVLFHNAPFARSGFLKRDLVLQQFMSALPLTIDGDEAKICHAGLCDLVESGENIDRSLLSTKAYEILSKIHEEGDDLATPETSEKLHAIVLHCNQQQGSLFSVPRAANIVSP